MSTITPLPDPPSRRDPVSFAARADEFLAALQVMVTEFNTAAFGSGAELAADMADATSVSKGDALQVVKKTFTDSVATTGHEVNERSVCALDALNPAQIADVRAKTGAVDVTGGISAAITAGSTLSKRVHFVDGVYSDTPSARRDLGSDLVGDSVNATQIRVQTGYVGEAYRVAGSYDVREIQIRYGSAGNTKTAGSIGLKLSATPAADFTGHQRLTRVNVFGFEKAVDIGNTFDVVLDQVRAEGAAVGLNATPPDEAGDNGYFNTALILNGHFTDNDKNVNMVPVLQAHVVVFVGGSQERAGAAPSQYTRVRQLEFVGHYFEGSSGIAALSLDDCSATLRSIFLSGTGGIVLGTNTEASLEGVRSNSGTDVLTCAGATQLLSMRDCQFPAVGNTFAAAHTVLLGNVQINGIWYREPVYQAAAGLPNPMPPQTISVSVAGATDVWRALRLQGTIDDGVRIGTLRVIATDNASGANQTTYELRLESLSNGIVDATITHVSRKVRGTDVGVSATPFTLANDGAGGAVKIQFQKNAAVAQVNLTIRYYGM